MTLDLEDGDPERAEATPAERRRLAREAADEGKSRSRSARSSSGGGSSGGGRTSAAQRAETELVSRLDRAFDRIAKALETRGDDELAGIIREDASAMGQGLVSLTHSVKFLRSPLLMLLNLIEPVLAFGRITRLLFTRAVEWRARKMWEHEQEQAIVQEGEVVDGEVVAGT